MKLQLKIATFIVLNFIINTTVSAQNDSISVRIPAIIENHDTVGIVLLKEITVYPKRDLSLHTEFNIRYIRLARKVLKVYPYAMLAAKILNEINDTLFEMESKREARIFMRKYDKALRTKYMGDLKHLTISEGRILIKLIDRETGRTSYNLVKDLRGKFAAVFWQSLARLFRENLKVHYDPLGRDKLIEEIVIKIKLGMLEPIPIKKK